MATPDWDEKGAFHASLGFFRSSLDIPQLQELAEVVAMLLQIGGSLEVMISACTSPATWEMMGGFAYPFHLSVQDNSTSWLAANRLPSSRYENFLVSLLPCCQQNVWLAPFRGYGALKG